MRMIPPVVFDDTSSRAERQVFALLEDTELGSEATAYHSLNLSSHDYKVLGELDFVVLTRKGLLVLEVKGGGVQRNAGVFVYTDRYGTEHRSSEGPFHQARSGMFSLRRRLIERFSQREIRQLVFGYAVVFPDCDFTEESVEWDPEIVLDGHKLRGRPNLNRELSAIQEYWQVKVGTETLAPIRLLEHVGKAIRPDFDRVASILYTADRLDAAMEHLTEEQYLILDAVEEHPRILCRGGAGTGKTFLAAETARRHAVEGSTVLFVCRSVPLAAFLSEQLASDGVEVLTFDRLAADSRQRDVLVVDEGQDLLNLGSLDTLDRVLTGGLEAGVWRLFYDPNNQSNLDGSFDPEVVDLLLDDGAVPLALRRNCRNTTEIVTQTRLLTGADLGNPMAGHGPPVHFEYVDSESDEAQRLTEWISGLLREDVPLKDIAILSGSEKPNGSSARLLPQRLLTQLSQLDSTPSRWPPTGLTFSSIIGFKGLENRFVALVDVPTPEESQRFTNTLYVGLSRARVGLWVAIRSADRPLLETMMNINLSAITEGLSE